jgi:hypothetical protein
MRWLWLGAAIVIAGVSLVIREGGQRADLAVAYELARATDFICGYGAALDDFTGDRAMLDDPRCQEIRWLARKLNVPRVGQR